MGHLVNATAFRLGYSKPWVSSWIAKKSLYKHYLQEDITIFRFIKLFFKDYSIPVFTDISNRRKRGEKNNKKSGLDKIINNQFIESSFIFSNVSISRHHTLEISCYFMDTLMDEWRLSFLKSMRNASLTFFKPRNLSRSKPTTFTDLKFFPKFYRKTLKLRRKKIKKRFAIRKSRAYARLHRKLLFPILKPRFVQRRGTRPADRLYRRVFIWPKHRGKQSLTKLPKKRKKFNSLPKKQKKFNSLPKKQKKLKNLPKNHVTMLKITKRKSTFKTKDKKMLKITKRKLTFKTKDKKILKMAASKKYDTIRFITINLKTLASMKQPKKGKNKLKMVKNNTKIGKNNPKGNKNKLKLGKNIPKTRTKRLPKDKSLTQILKDFKSNHSKINKTKRKFFVFKFLRFFPTTLYDQKIQTFAQRPLIKNRFKLLKVCLLLFQQKTNCWKQQHFFITLMKNLVLSLFLSRKYVPSFIVFKVLNTLILKQFAFKHLNFFYFKKIFYERYLILQNASYAIAHSVTQFARPDKMKINFFGQHTRNISASFIANYILIKLGQYFTIHDIVRPFLKKIKNMHYMKGFRIIVAGRLTRKERAAYIVRTSGAVTLGTKSCHIDYAADFKIMRFGVVGVKVWFHLTTIRPYFYVFRFTYNTKRIKEATKSKRLKV